MSVTTYLEEIQLQISYKSLFDFYFVLAIASLVALVFDNTGNQKRLAFGSPCLLVTDVTRNPRLRLDSSYFV